MSQQKAQCEMNSKIGPLYLVASAKGLCGVFWKKQKVPMGESSILKKAEKELNEFLDGKRKKFSFALDVEGTDFQKKVWDQLAKIPYGDTVSYQEIAKKIKNPKAVRAVGTANGKNPLCLIVPCHRVIASDGSLGGYSGGLKIKAWLLQLENSKQ